MIVDSLEAARRADRDDPLSSFRARFALPEGVVYLDGNSLGALPLATIDRVTDTVMREWGQDLVCSWNSAGWIDAPQRVGGKIARLIGAKAHEVIVADSTSANLYKLLMAAVAARPGRSVILTEPGNFPTDLYIAQGVASSGSDIEVRTVERAQVMEAIDEQVAVVLLTHVHYKTAERFDMTAITRLAHEKGALVLWDLSHSVGAVQIDLNGAGADLAVGCGYKYLNGGPGAPAFLYVAEALQQKLRSPMTGWMGHAAPFAFDDDYRPAEGIRRFLAGTPPIIGLAALETGVDLILEADMAALVEKSERLCALFTDLVEAHCTDWPLSCVSPRAPAPRGSHVSFAHPDAYPVMQALIDRGVIGDFRAPDILRFGFTPLYLGYEDVWIAAETLKDILANEVWRRPAYQVRAAVT